MAEKYDKNGYNSGDFKRNSNANEDQDGEPVKLNEKAGEYMRELLSEKIKLDEGTFPVSTRLLDQEVSKLQATGRIPLRDPRYVDVFRDKPTKVVVKVVLPIKEHPKFNFVGKLLGPKGHTLKQLQEETMCKMAILGKGSMRDKQKEDELRNSLDPKFSHLSDELHVEISSIAPPAEAHARIAYALAEVKKYLIPDPVDGMRPPQMRDIDRGMSEHPRGPPMGPPRRDVQYDMKLTPRSLSYQEPGPQPNRPRRPPPPGAPHPHAHPHPPPKKGVMSILERARSAMEGYPPYEDPYAAPEPPMRGPRGAPEADYYNYDRGQERFYEDDYYKDEGRDYKGSSREVGTRRPVAPPQRHFQPRAAPYNRPQKGGPPNNKKQHGHH